MMTNAEQWIITAALVQAALIAVLIILIKNEGRRTAKKSRF